MFFYSSTAVLQPQAGDVGGQQPSQGHENVAQGQGFQPGLHIESHAVGIDPEIGVIHMAAGSGPGTGCQENQDGVQPQTAGNGCTQGGRRGYGNGPAPLHNLQQPGNHKGNQDEGQACVDHHLGQAGAGTGCLQHRPQSPAGGGNEYDGPGVLQGGIHDLQDFFTANAFPQENDGQHGTNGQCHVGIPDKGSHGQHRMFLRQQHGSRCVAHDQQQGDHQGD